MHLKPETTRFVRRRNSFQGDLSTFHASCNASKKPVPVRGAISTAFSDIVIIR